MLNSISEDLTTTATFIYLIALFNWTGPQVANANLGGPVYLITERVFNN